jgi:hypothetical protein
MASRKLVKEKARIRICNLVVRCHGSSSGSVSKPQGSGTLIKTYQRLNGNYKVGGWRKVLYGEQGGGGGGVQHQVPGGRISNLQKR